MLTTGVRNSSVRLLRLEDVDFERNCLTFRHGKKDKTLVVALQSATKAALLRYVNRARKRLLARYPVRGFESITAGRDSGYVFLASDSGYGKGEPLTTNGLSQMLNRRYHQGGGTIAHFGSHRIRHAIGTALANNGMGVVEVGRVLGHSSTDVTKRYANQTYDVLGRMVGETLQRAGVITTSARRRRGA
jgi:site-specific recombinase XerD